MALVKIPDQNKTLTEETAIKQALASCGVEYEKWIPGHPVATEAPAQEILQAYSREIEELKERGGYVTADVIDVKPDTPGLDEMLAKFSREHTHDEDEVRFIVEGHGLFHIRPKDGAVIAVQVEPGDLISVPKGTLHWFDLCADRRVRAIRLFQNPSGWTPRYTDSGMEQKYEPVCFGPAFVSPEHSSL